MKIGILDIQGSVEEHESCLQKLGVEVVLVKEKKDLENLSGLIIPGGESTTLHQLIDRFDLHNEILQKAKQGMAIYGTCAGAIILADFNLINIKIERNGYGRQLDSFETEVSTISGSDFVGQNKKIPAIFIRAPKILSADSNVQILASFEESIVAARQNKILITTFHPELTDNLTLHQYFVEMCK